MKEKTLIVYASRYGSTEDIAQRVGQVLGESGLSVDVQSVADIGSLDDYATVIVGGAIYSGQWDQELIDFVSMHENILRSTPAAMFIVAIRLRENTEEMRESVLGTVEKQRLILDPLTVGFFAGKIDYSQLSPIVRLQIQKKSLPEGDFRDWNAIDDWANGLVELLQNALIEHDR